MTEQKPDPRRIFVGNLSFDTSAEDIGKLFEQQGEVQEALIVSRHDHSLGFGFVTMKNEADAAKAIEALKGSQLHNRTITVQLSKSTGPHPPRPRDPNAPPRRRPMRNYRSYRRPNQRLRRNRPPPDPNAPLSKTRIYVRNIPYRMRDGEFEEVFKDYQTSQTLIIRNQFDGGSRGFGFVECKTPEEQQRLLSEHKTMVLLGRTVTLEPAHERAQPQPTPSS